MTRKVPEIVRATEEHVAAMAPHLRDADREEILISTRMTPAESLHYSMTMSPIAYTALEGDTPICMFGAGTANPLSFTGSPWLLATDDLDRWGFQLGKLCRRYVVEMFDRFDYLCNYVDERNTKAVRWLEWIGFTIHDAAPHGPYGMPFHKFDMEAPTCVRSNTPQR